MPESPRRPRAAARDSRAAAVLAEAFRRAGWDVERGARGGQWLADLVVRRRGVAYVAAVNAGPEGRPDRLVPLFALAVLRAARAAGKGVAPLAVVAAPRIAPGAAERVLRFAGDYAPRSAAGVVDLEGLRQFRGAHLEGMNGRPAERPAVAVSPPRRESGQLFSDLNQWMLKVLLAPELPETLLSAPRGRYRNASELARAAGVSVMSAFRLVRLLGHGGYLHESSPHFRLVRRGDLFERWQASARRTAVELPARFVLPGDARKQLRELLGEGRACLALFAAADALGLGFVEGPPPHVYVPRVRGAVLAAHDLRPSAPGEAPHLILREAQAPQSVFRGVVRPGGIAVSDVLQVWIDVAGHPARGREQAELVRRSALQGVIAGKGG